MAKPSLPEHSYPGKAVLGIHILWTPLLTQAEAQQADWCATAALPGWSWGLGAQEGRPGPSDPGQLSDNCGKKIPSVAWKKCQVTNSFF